MSYKLTADIKGLEELESAFRKAPDIVNNELKTAIGKTAFFIESEAKSNAPIQYGNLRGSIHTVGPYGNGLSIEAKVGTNLNYAPYQEKGTGIYADKGMIVPKKKKILAWKQDGQWIFAKAVRGVPGKFYFKKAFEAAKPRFSEFMKAALAHITSALSKD